LRRSTIVTKYDETTRQWYYHYFLKEQSDLNWRNPEVFDLMCEFREVIDEYDDQTCFVALNFTSDALALNYEVQGKVIFSSGKQTGHFDACPL